jgi:hypothetical protein
MSFPLRFAALLPLLIFLPAGLEAQTRLYRSNGVGMALEEIPAARRAEYEYVLEVRSQKEGRVERLYRAREEVRRWEHTLDLQGNLRETRVLRGDVAEEVQVFGGDGKLLEERGYEDGRLASRTLYRYSGAGLSLVEVYDGEGSLLYRDRYQLNGQGGLRGVRREPAESPGEARRDPGGPIDSPAGFALVRAQNRLFEERLTTGEEQVLSHYDARGRLRQREVWREGERVVTEDYRYAEERLETMVQVDNRTKATMTHTYDDRGQVALEEVARPGAPVERTRYFRDGEGRPQRSIRQGERGIEEWRYAYDGEGRLQTEEYHLKGALVKVVRYEAEDRRTEELYRRGAVFLRVTYQGDEKVREEVIMEGLVVRVREYGGQDVLHAREATDGDMPAKPPRGFLE